MRVKSVSVRNYRSLVDVTVYLDGLTVLIGPNGSGKTSVLRAIELFSADAPPVTARDFNDEDKEIQVDLALSSEGAGEELAPYVVDGEIRLRQVYKLPTGQAKPGAKPTQKNYILTRLNADFDELKRLKAAGKIATAIESLKKNKIYADLPECAADAKEWRPRFLRYERGFCLGHPDLGSVRLAYDEWDLVLLKPGRLLDIVYVPAMRDIAGDAAAGFGSHLRKLFNIAIDYARDNDPDVSRAAQGSVSANKEYFGLVKTKLVPGLNDDLNTESQRFAKGATVTIELGSPDDGLPPFSPSIVLGEGNGAGGEETGGMDIEHVGGGLQRVYLMALLKTIGDQKKKAAKREFASRARLVMIDEPEIYQHPQRQRVILRGLGDLAGDTPGIQILCSTHSPYFVELSRIDSLRLLTRDGETSVHVATRQEIMGPILDRYRTDMPDGAALDRWLDTNASHWMTEALFSRLAVIVEGVDDRNVLLAAAAVLGTDLNEHEITIVPAHGKQKICPVAHLFAPFGIPLYLVWDLDEGNDDGEENDRLLRLADPGNFERHRGLRETAVEDRFSCFRTNLTMVLHGEIDGQKRALEAAGGWKGLLGPHWPKLKREKHCDTCRCERVEPPEDIKRLLGSRDVVHDVLLRIREADEGAFDSLKPVEIVRMLVKAAQAPRAAAERGAAGGCAG